MRWLPGIVTSFLLVAMLGAAVSADEGGQLQENRQELSRVKRQLEDTRNKIDSLKSVETDLQKAIAGYNDQVNRNRKLVDKLGGELQTVRGQLSGNKQDLILTEDRLSRLRSRYLTLLLDYYRENRTHADFSGWDYEEVLRRNRLSKYLGSLTGVSAQEIVMAGDSVQRLSRSMDSLTAAGADLRQLRNQKKAKIDLDVTLREKQEASLGGVQRQTGRLQDRLVSLSEMARQMEEIIAQLEREQQRRLQEQGPRARYQTGSFTTAKGSLAPPIKGRIISSFGWKTDPVTNLKSFSPGIDIQPAKGYKEVMASAPGRVVYVGVLRGYENFVILEHDDGFYTTYAGLATPAVTVDELVITGSRLGSCGTGQVHFELRQGREHLDPVIWLDIDEF